MEIIAGTSPTKRQVRQVLATKYGMATADKDLIMSMMTVTMGHRFLLYIYYIYRIIMTPNSIAWLDPIFGKLNPITKPYCYRHNLRKSNYCTWWYVQLNPINFPNLDLLEPAPVAELTMAFLAILAASANLPPILRTGEKTTIR